VATGSVPEEDLHLGLISLLASLVLHLISASAFSVNYKISNLIEKLPIY